MALGVVQLMAFLVFAAMVIPPVRRVLLSFGVILLGAVILVCLVAFGIFLLR